MKLKGVLNAELIEACKRGDLKEVKRLLSEGADKDAKDSFQIPAVEVAANSGQVEVMEYLFDQGAEVKDERALVVGAVRRDDLRLFRRFARCYGDIHFENEAVQFDALTILKHIREMEPRRVEKQSLLMVAFSHLKFRAFKYLTEEVGLKLSDSMAREISSRFKEASWHELNSEGLGKILTYLVYKGYVLPFDVETVEKIASKYLHEVVNEEEYEIRDEENERFTREIAKIKIGRQDAVIEEVDDFRIEGKKIYFSDLPKQIQMFIFKEFDKTFVLDWRIWRKIEKSRKDYYIAVEYEKPDKEGNEVRRFHIYTV